MKEPYYNKAIQFENLYRGLNDCSRGVRWKDGVAIYRSNALRNTLKLRQDLLNGKYKIKPYRYFTITDPKKREVMSTSIRDRQFQRSICDNGLYEDLTEHFLYTNGACQRGKGVDFALDGLERDLHRFYRKRGSADGWVLKCDIRHYFAETSHDIAKAAVRKRISDDDAYRAVCQIIDSFPGEKGIGLGSEVSQLIELCVLDDLDHYIKEQLGIKYYHRYMDDFVLIHESKEVLQRCLKEIVKRLAEIGLELNNKTQIYHLRQGVVWLKWKLILTGSGKVLRRASHEKINAERRKLKRMHKKGVSYESAAQSFMSWAAGIERRKAKKEYGEKKGRARRELRWPGRNYA